MTKLEELRKEINNIKDLAIEEVIVIYFKNKDIKERYKDLHIDFIQLNHFGYYSIEQEIKITKSELIIYTNAKGVSKVLRSRY